MQRNELENLCKWELQQGQQLIHTGVAGRLLSEGEGYPAIVAYYEKRLEEQVAQLTAALSNANPERLRQELNLLKEAAAALESGRTWQPLMQQLHSILPYNLQGVQDVMTPDVLYKEVLTASIARATLLVLTQYQPSPTTTSAQVLATGKTLIRLVFDVRTVANEMLRPHRSGNTPELPVDESQQTLADAVRQGDSEKILRLFRGNALMSAAVADDIAVLCGAAVRPLHTLEEFAASMRGPGSIVWSDAALYLFVAETTFQHDAAPALISLLLQERDEPNMPTRLTDPSIMQLFVLGVEALREYYAKHPAAKPAFDVPLPTPTASALLPAPQNVPDALRDVLAPAEAPVTQSGGETLLELAQGPQANGAVAVNGQAPAAQPAPTPTEPTPVTPPTNPEQPGQQIPVQTQTRKVKPINVS